MSTSSSISVPCETPTMNTTGNYTSGTDENNDALYILIGLVVAVTVVVLLLLSIIIAILVRKRNKKRTGQFNVSETWCVSNVITTVERSSGETRDVESQQTTELNGEWSRHQKEPFQPSGQFSEVHRSEISDTEPNRRYSAETTDHSGQKSVVQRKPEHSTAASDSYTVDQLSPKMETVLQQYPFKTIKEAGGNAADKPVLSHPPTIAVNAHTLHGSEACNVRVKSDNKKDPDQNVGLDQILIQLKEVSPQWRTLAETVGLDHETLNGISEYATSDSEAMVEVVDGWLAKLYPKKPTWREIADVVESIGHSSLADSIKGVYTTGSLPKEVSSAVPDILSVQKEAPPPIPPRLPDDDMDSPQRAPPPLPAKPTIYSP